jgi:hypothetical protein
VETAAALGRPVQMAAAQAAVSDPAAVVVEVELPG